MIIQEMLYEVDRLLETIDPKFKVEEKPDTDTMLLALNISQTRFIYDKYLNKGTAAETINFLRKKSDDLRALIVPDLLNPVAITIGPYAGFGYTIDLTTTSKPYLFYLRSDSYVQRTVSLPTDGYVWTPNEIADSFEDLEKITTTLYNKPILRQPVIALQATGILLLTDTYTTVNPTNGVYLTYLRQPKYLGLTDTTTVTTTCELAVHTHEEIVRMAVDIFIKEYKFLLGAKQTAKA